jgi:hypothetical protein
MFNKIEKTAQSTNQKIFVYGGNMSGKTFRSLKLDKPENIFLLSFDGKAEQVSHQANTINIDSIETAQSVLKHVRDNVSKDKIIIIDIISRAGDMIRKAVATKFGVEDMSIAPKGQAYDPRQGWATYNGMYKNLVTMINSLPHTVVVTDHECQLQINDTKTFEIVPILKAERPSKPIQYTSLLDQMDFVLRTYFRGGQYYVAVESTRGGELPNAFK